MNIKDLRTATGMTQKEFADYFDIPFRTLQNWEGGQRNPPDYLVELIEYKLIKEGLMLSHLEIYGLNMKVVPASIIPMLQKSEFVKKMDYVETVKDGQYLLQKYHLLVKEMVYTNTVRPEKQITVFAGSHIKNIQDYMPHY